MVDRSHSGVRQEQLFKPVEGFDNIRNSQPMLQLNNPLNIKNVNIKTLVPLSINIPKKDEESELTISKTSFPGNYNNKSPLISS